MTDEERSEAVGHSNVRCTLCKGVGSRIIRHGREVFCNCAYRGLFHEVMGRYHRAAHQLYGERSMLFRADVDIAARVLPAELQILWKLFHAQATKWEECLAHPQLHHLDRGSFFTKVYAIEQRLGKELLRRGIAPCWKYFDWGHAPIFCRPVTATSSLTKSALTQNLENWQHHRRRDESELTGTTYFNARQRAVA